MGGSLPAKETVSFHKGRLVHQPLSWSLVWACITTGTPSIPPHTDMHTISSSLCPPCEASFALNDFHMEASLPLTK